MASFDEDDPDVIVLPGTRGPASRPRFTRLYILLALLFGGFLLVHNAVPLYTDWLWFQEVGFSNVFTTTIAAKTTLFVIFGLLFFAVFYGNIRIARRLAPDTSDRFLMERFGPQWGQKLQKGIGWLALGTAGFFSLWVGRLAAESWANWLEFWNGESFHLADPVFGNDVGFYVFRLPFLHSLWEFVIGTLLITLVAVVFIHIADRAIETWAGLPNVAPGVRAQLLTLLGLLALTQAFGTRLGAYDLLFSDNGKFSGAGYADLHYRLFALNAQILFLILTALACFASILLGFRKSGGQAKGRGSKPQLNSRPYRPFLWPITGIAGWLFSVLVLGSLVPGIGQKTYVEPNEFSMEKEYIQRNIEFTRRGFGLQEVKRIDTFPADESLTAAGIQSNRDTLDNVRLWDYQYLGKVYSQLQSVKTYYKFEQDTAGGGKAYNIDIDRYPIGGRQRQVMLGAREIDTSGLPESAQSWQNQRLSYTHGYGVVMSPVNKIIDGLPDYFVSGIPLTISPEARELQVSQPNIYYGQLSHDYVFVDTEQTEFDYPSGGSTGAGGAKQDHYTRYTGKGGIRIGDSPLVKLAFSLRLGDSNLVLTRSLKPETRLLFRRDIRDRVQTVAPFVQQDADPYLVVEPASGKLVWVLDCYTISDRFPYSTQQEVGVTPLHYIAPNYIRNSVKATVDAYDGTVHLYLADPQDPIARTYSKIFPGLLQPLAQMPAGLRAHLRYPEDLFRLQRSVYATYHVDDPRVFYFQEDTWAIPNEPNADAAAAKSGAAQQQMEPYYVIMRLPDMEPASQTTDALENRKSKIENPLEEFLLMSPLAPIKRENQNILGWMCARCDGDHYGELVLYRFPQQASVNGPSQVIAFINNDPIISSQLSLLRSGGSSATFGNLLVIPVEKSLLAIAPLYIESTTGATGLPKLQKVVVAFGQRVAMADTLPKALADLFGAGSAPGESEPTPNGSSPSRPPVGASSTVSVEVRNLIERASVQYETARQKLKAEDWAGYGAATKELERTLNDLRRAGGIQNKR